MFSQSQPTTEVDLTLPSSQDSSRDSDLTDPHNEQSGNDRFTLHNAPYTMSSNKSSRESNDVPVETITAEDESKSQVSLTELKRKIKQLEHDIKQKNKQVEMYKATVKELMIEYEQVKLKSDSAERKMMDLKDDNRILQYQLTETSRQAKEDEDIIDDLEYEVKQLHSVLYRVRMERDSMQRHMSNSLGRWRPSFPYPMYQQVPCDPITDRYGSPSPEPSCTQTTDNQNGSTRDEPPPSRHCSVDQLRRQLSQKDLAIHHKMNQMAQMCQDFQDVPMMRRRWHSEYRLGRMY